MDNATLKSALKSPSSVTDGLAAKVRNIEGKIRILVRNVSFTRPLNDIANAQHVEDGSNKVQSVEDDSQHDGNVHFATNTMNDVHGHSVGTTSFAFVLQHKHTKKKVAVSELRNDERVAGAAVVIPMEVVKEVSSAFDNTLYGYFIGKRLAFPLVENYFSTSEGMEKVLESGPWLVRLALLNLNIWSPNEKLTKDEVRLAPVWVKLHNVLILAYSEIGLSLIATQLGRPIMFDSYTSSMCLDPWGKCTYARVLIEMRADKELMNSLVVAVPFTNGKGHSLDNIEVEYKWKPPRCATCYTFNHNDDKCPKIVKEVNSTPNNQVDEQGFTTINRKKSRTVPKKQVAGIRLSKPKPNMVYRRVKKGESDGVGLNSKHVDKDPSSSTKGNNMEHKNSFNSLGGDTNDNWFSAPDYSSGVFNVINENDSEDVNEELIDEEDRRNVMNDNKGASTPSAEDASAGSSFMDISMREFKECIKEIELIDVPRSGLQFTWNQKPQGSNGILKKLDRVMANVEFSNEFVGNYAVFQPYEVVKEGWSDRVCGFYMFRVVKKLKSLKKPLRKLLYDKGNLHDNDLRDEEDVYVRAFTEALIMEEIFLKQKAKIEWLKVGDSNSTYFHKSVRGRTSRNRIDVVTDFGVIWSRALDMIKHVTAQEVKEAIFSMGNDKSLGPDGYTACFFKECRDIVASDVVCAVQEFFTNRNLLKELNHTIIALIPKVNSPSRINDYWPISCCNVLFKCITKIISNRIKESLKGLISPNQSAFVSGRRISDNILLTQELMHNYHLDCGPSRCAFKIDIQKAYDTVDWGFLKEVLLAFGFHVRMVDWIMECVTTTSFSLSINDIIAIVLIWRSLIFVLRMIYSFFSHGDPYSVKVIMKAMEEFKNASGLTPSLTKSTAYFCNVLNHTKLSILQILPFEEGHLPVKYLGVPLVSSRLVFKDCKELVDRIRSRINDWKNKSLSVAGRLQLVQSVLGSMHGDEARESEGSWEVVCLPKNEGGLGVRRLDLFNKALMVPYIWNLITRKESLWVKWIHQYKLRGFVLVMEKLALFDAIHNGEWLWPVDWFSKYPLLNSVVVPTLSAMHDRLEWRDWLEIVKPFSVNVVWNCIHPRDAVVNWVFVSMHCSLCDGQPDSHEHLFFDCGFSKQVWEVKSLAGLPNVIGSILIIVDLLIPFAKQRSARSVVANLVVAACSYYIWQERNLRLFMNQKRSHSQVTDCIKSSIRLKLLSCTFKKSKDALLFKRLWNLPDSIFW
uniref:Reverse transcriptase domain-containing protein n=1 Tax=Tanacetum cinerariifolium TaxID=118510 RepID=A0A6L2JH57_TANCI|nr:hypothetical protein [Tanacetum cinerariifolium]